MSLPSEVVTGELSRLRSIMMRRISATLTNGRYVLGPGRMTRSTSRSASPRSSAARSSPSTTRVRLTTTQASHPAATARSRTSPSRSPGGDSGVKSEMRLAGTRRRQREETPADMADTAEDDHQEQAKAHGPSLRKERNAAWWSWLSALSSGGLPVGMQIVGRRYADADVFAASAAFERLRPWAETYQRCRLA